jgi:hypothetical protein
MAYSTPFRIPLILLVTVGVMGVVFHFMQERTEGSSGRTPGADPCSGLTAEACRAMESVDPGRAREDMEASSTGNPMGEILRAEEVCFRVGYLCAQVESSGADTILRWPGDTPLIRVWVPEPPGVSPQAARVLQRAAANGIRIWHEFPFPLEVSTRSVAQDPDITVEWRRSLGGNRLGHAGMRWSKIRDEIRVEITGLQLATHYPSNPDVELTPEQIQLVAAHEMGHALGLPHSDDPRDVMYAQNTAWRRTRRDFETMEALYRLPNGAIITR